MRYGSSYFVDLQSAIAYYATQEIDETAVMQKLAEGAISLGIPPIKERETANVNSENRYEVCDENNNLTILGYEWFDRVNGNSYCRAKLILNGKTVHITDYENGYGDYYVQSAFEWLDKSGLVSPRLQGEAYWQWSERTGITLTSEKSKVTKRQLLAM